MNALKLFKNLTAPQIDAKASIVDELPEFVKVEYDAQLFCKDQLTFLSDIVHDNDPSGNQTLRWAIFLNYCLNQQPACLAGLDENDRTFVALVFKSGNLLFSPAVEITDEPELKSLVSLME